MPATTKKVATPKLAKEDVIKNLKRLAERFAAKAVRCAERGDEGAANYNASLNATVEAAINLIN